MRHGFAWAMESLPIERIFLPRQPRPCGESSLSARGRKHREKRGGGAEHVDVDELEIAAPPGNEEESLAVHEALDRLAAQDARKAEVVKLRYFVGFSFEETAEVLGISVITAKRDWAYARAWLHQEIAADRPRFLD